MRLVAENPDRQRRAQGARLREFPVAFLLGGARKETETLAEQGEVTRCLTCAGRGLLLHKTRTTSLPRAETHLLYSSVERIGTAQS